VHYTTLAAVAPRYLAQGFSVGQKPNEKEEKEERKEVKPRSLVFGGAEKK
jgi:hypothetical protein